MKRLCLLAAALYVPFAAASFKCIDEKGRTHIGDTPPPQCEGVVMYEVSRSGQVMRKIDPTPTADQLKAREEERQKQKAADKLAAEQKRKDMALLTTYASEHDFDIARDRNTEPIKRSIATARDRLKEVDKRTQKLEEEMEFYKAGKSGKSAKGKEPPPALTGDLLRLQSEKQQLLKTVANYEKEIAQLGTRYEVDKKRWVALKSIERGDAAPKAAPAEAAPQKAAIKKN